MSPLGLQMTTIGSLGGESFDMGSRAALIEDKFWVGWSDKAGVNCELWPVPVTSDFNDVWDLDGNNDYVPQDSTTLVAGVTAEGWWEVNDNGELTPIQASCKA